MSDDLRTNTCPKCKATSEQVLNMETGKRVGWYCLKCHHFEAVSYTHLTLPTNREV